MGSQFDHSSSSKNIMIDRAKILIVSILLSASSSCSRSSSEIVVDDQVDVVQFSVQLGASCSDDANSIDDDNTFSSLLLYIFNSNGALERAEFVESLSSIISTQIDIETTVGKKSICAIANYVDHEFVDGEGSEVSVYGVTTLEEFEDLEVVSRDGLVSDNLVMVATSDVNISVENLSVSILLERLAARIDLHLFLGDGFDSGCDDVTITEAKICNCVYNSNLIVDRGMPSEVLYFDQEVDLNIVIDEYDCDVEIKPSEAIASFYSYSNIVDNGADSSVYLVVELDEDGTKHRYEGSICCDDELSITCSLVSNNVYQVVATLTPNREILVEVKLDCWNETEIELYLD